MADHLKKIDDYEQYFAEDDFKDLSPRHAIFVREYMRHGNGERAIISAGYSEKNASSAAARMNARPDIMDVIAKIKARVIKETAYTLDAAIKRQEDILQRCIELKQMTAAVKAKEHLDILTGHFNPRLDINMQVKAGFSLNLGGLALPEYAKETLDVTPQKKLNGDTET